MDAFTGIAVQDLWPLIVFLAGLGALAGFLAGLLGVGGGIVLVPGIFFILETMRGRIGFGAADLIHVAVGTSLAVIVPTGLSSAMAHRRRDSVDFDLVRRIGIGVIAGVAAATVVADGLSGAAMKTIFAAALLGLAGLMFLDPARFRFRDRLPPQPFPALAGALIGGFSALVGIGGATLSVPYMSLHGVPMRRAVGTASALGLVIALPAAFGFILIGLDAPERPPFSLGYVNVLAWGCIVPLSVLVAPLGARAAHKVSVTALRKGFALFMVAVALNMWRKVFFP